jgi:cell division protease FtsH
MSKVLGPLAYQQGQQSMFLGNSAPNPRRMLSEETTKAIDYEVKEIIETAHTQALQILTQNRDLLEAIASQLIETEVIEGEKLQGWLSQVHQME